VMAAGGFIWDDDDYVTANPYVRDAGGLRDIWTPGKTRQYYPAVFTAFWMEYQLWGDEARGYHIVNVLLHVANSLLLWRIMTVLGIRGAWLIAAVFALHPVHVESVAWITERKNVLSGFFYLAAGLCWLRFDPPGASVAGDDHRDLKDVEQTAITPCPSPKERGGYWWYAACLVLFVLALLSKTVTCTLPAALMLVMLLKRQRITWQRLAFLAPMFTIGFVFAMQTAALERSSVGAIGGEFELSFIERCLVASKALLFYPWKIVWPWPVMFVYPRWTIDAGDVWPYRSVLAVLLVGAGALWLFVRGRRGPFIGLAFSAGTVFPALGFFNVFPHQYSWVADHFQYLASIGIIALLIGGLSLLLRCEKRLTLAGMVILVPCAVLTWAQSATYQNAETVWRDTLSKNDQAWLAHANLASIVLLQADSALRAADVDAATRLAGEAEHHARRATEINPANPQAHANRAEALRLLGRFAEAVKEQDTALEEARGRLSQFGAVGAPVLAGMMANLARLHQLAEQYTQAEAAYQAAIEMAGSFEQALPIMVELIRLHSNCPDPMVRSADKAIAMAETVVQLTGRDPTAMMMLANEHAKAGRFGQADAAITEIEERGLPDFADRMRRQIEQYRPKENPGKAEDNP